MLRSGAKGRPGWATGAVSCGVISQIIAHCAGPKMTATSVFSRPSLATDPGYGILGPYEGHKAEFELPTRVYRIDGQTGKITIVTEGPMRRPNGICFSPDFSKVYVVDTGATDGPDYPANIIVFDVVKDGTAVSGGKYLQTLSPASRTVFAVIPTATCGVAGVGVA